MYSIQANVPPKYMKSINSQNYSVGGFSTDATMKSKNTQSKKNQKALFYMPYVDKYKQNHKIQLTQIQKQKVQGNNFIKREADRKYKDRQAMTDLYLKYNFNPFMALNPKQSKNQFRKQIKSKAKNIVVVDVVDIMSPNQEGTPNVNRQQIQKIGKYKNQRDQSVLRSQKIIQNTSRSQTDRDKYQQKSQRHEESQKTQKKGIKKLQNRQEDYQYDDLSFDIDKIVAYKQPNFFMEQNKKINVFKLLFSDNEDQISPKSQLQKYNFEFNSIIEKNYKFRIPIFRDLSTMGRAIMTNSYHGKQKVSDHIFSHQMTLNFKQLRFIDIINVASNRFSPQLLYRRIIYPDKKSEGSIEKTVRFRKINCDRSGTIRLKYLNKMMKDKQRLQQMQKLLGRKNYLRTEYLR